MSPKAAKVVLACAAAGAGYMAFVQARSYLRKRWQEAILAEYRAVCDVPIEKLKSVVHAFVVEMHAGLATEGGSRLKMLTSFVERLPMGSEHGEYFALDLGGTNFRVMRVVLSQQRDGHIDSVDHKECAIPPEAMTGTATQLFDFIAGAFADFVEERGFAVPKKSALGFCFSFPLNQTAIDEGALINWTKGFTTEGVEGKDVVGLLQEALVRVRKL